MVVKAKEKVEKSRHITKKDKYKKYILRGEGNVSYHDRTLSNKKKFYNLTKFFNFTTE